MTNTNLISHLIILRKKLILILVVFLLIFLSLIHFANSIYAILADPLFAYLPSDTKLIATDILSPFLAPLKLTALISFLIAMPHTIYQIWSFINPALYKKEKTLFGVILIFAIILFLLGILFSYFIVLPSIFHFINNIKSSEIQMMTDINKYLDFVLTLFMLFGICFQIPLIIFLLNYFAIISRTQLIKLRPYIFVGCFILGAIIAPPDVISQTLLAIPLYVLFEIALAASKIFIKPLEINHDSDLESLI